MHLSAVTPTLTPLLSFSGTDHTPQKDLPPLQEALSRMLKPQHATPITQEKLRENMIRGFKSADFSVLNSANRKSEITLPAGFSTPKINLKA